jgi:hypothetical protein
VFLAVLGFELRALAPAGQILFHLSRIPALPLVISRNNRSRTDGLGPWAPAAAWEARDPGSLTLRIVRDTLASTDLHAQVREVARVSPDTLPRLACPELGGQVSVPSPQSSERSQTAFPRERVRRATIGRGDQSWPGTVGTSVPSLSLAGPLHGTFLGKMKAARHLPGWSTCGRGSDRAGWHGIDDKTLKQSRRKPKAAIIPGRINHRWEKNNYSVLAGHERPLHKEDSVCKHHSRSH